MLSHRTHATYARLVTVDFLAAILLQTHRGARLHILPWAIPPIWRDVTVLMSQRTTQLPGIFFSEYIKLCPGVSRSQ